MPLGLSLAGACTAMASFAGRVLAGTSTDAARQRWRAGKRIPSWRTGIRWRLAAAIAPRKRFDLKARFERLAPRGLAHAHAGTLLSVEMRGMTSIEVAVRMRVSTRQHQMVSDAFSADAARDSDDHGNDDDCGGGMSS